jgi:hypothetical protein
LVLQHCSSLIDGCVADLSPVLCSILFLKFNQNINFMDCQVCACFLATCSSDSLDSLRLNWFFNSFCIAS